MLPTIYFATKPKEKENDIMEIVKVKNYKAFAETLEKETNCKVNIKLMGKNHIHYELSKDGISLGVLCLNDDEASFAPFVTHETAKDSQYISVQYMPMLDDFIAVLKVFGRMFVCDEA